jgi:predicted alpha/beta superfamily hydrolase
MAKRVMGTVEQHDKSDSYTIMFMEDYYQKNRAILNFMVTQFNEEKERMRVIGNDLVIHVDTDKPDKTDIVLDKIFNFILKV